MDTINVLVTHPIGEACLRQIGAVNPKIRVYDVSIWIAAERKGDFSAAKAFDEVLAKAEIVMGEWPPANAVARAPGLKWIQSIRAGMNRFTEPALVASPVVFTNFPHGTPVGEYAVFLMMALAKQAALSFQLKEAGQWGHYTPAMLEGKTVGILGLGHVGRKVARVCQAFGIKVMAMEVAQLAHAPHVDVILTPEKLPELLAAADFVVIGLPLTPQTRKLIGEAQLKAMKPTAFLINVARGPIIDEAALIRALDEHWIAGAGLDVFATEPLPPDSPLWQKPNVVLSPHVAGHMVDYDRQATDLFCRNLKRYLGGRKLHHIVDMKRGF